MPAVFHVQEYASRHLHARPLAAYAPIALYVYQCPATALPTVIAPAMTPDGLGPLHFDPATFLVDDLWVIVPPGTPAPDRQPFLAVDLGYADGKSVRVVPAFTDPGRAADYLAGSGLGARGYAAVSPASRLGLATALAQMQAVGESFVGIDPTARPDPTRRMPLLPIDAMVSALAEAEADGRGRAGRLAPHTVARL